MSDLIKSPNNALNVSTANGNAGSAFVVPEMTTRDYIKVLFRQKAVVLLTIITVSLSTYAGLQLKTPVYEAQVKLLVTAEKQVDSLYYRDMYEGGRNTEISLTQSEIVKSKPVLERAIAALGLHKRPLNYESLFATPLKKSIVEWRLKRLDLDKLSDDAQKGTVYRYVMEDLKENIKVEPVRDTHLFVIRARDFNPIGAAIIANAISRSYIIFDLEQQYVDLQAKYTEKNPLVVQMRDNITKMEKGLSGQPLPNIDAIGPASVKIIEQATPPLKPLGLPKKLTLALAIVMSIFLGVFLAFMFEYMDQSFHSKNDLESFLGVPVIACINKKKSMGDKKVVVDVTDANRAPRATSYRILAEQIQFMIKTKGYRSLLFSPVHPKEDVSSVIANVAVYLSKRMSLKVLLIDGDLRHPHLHKMFGKNERNERGLAQLLDGSLKPEDVTISVGDKITLIKAGRSLSDPGLLIDTTKFSQLLNTIRSQYDIILIQGSNLRDFRDATLVGPAVDGLIVVVGESTVRRQVVHYAVKHLREHNTKVIGAIMPNRNYLLPKFLYESV